MSTTIKPVYFRSLNLRLNFIELLLGGGEVMFKNIQRFAEFLLLNIVAIAMGTSVSVASPVQAVADIIGCNDVNINGSAKLKERYSEASIYANLCKD